MKKRVNHRVEVSQQPSFLLSTVIVCRKYQGQKHISKNVRFFREKEIAGHRCPQPLKSGPSVYLSTHVAENGLTWARSRNIDHEGEWSQVTGRVFK